MRYQTSAFIAVALLLTSSAAQAVTCLASTAGYGQGDFGADAVTSIGCATQGSSGGTGSTIAAVIGAPRSGLQASANLHTGVLTAYSKNGVASSAMWDTLTFSGLPAIGASLTETLSLTGSITGNAWGSITLGAGTPSGPNSTYQNWNLSKSYFPTSVAFTFEAHNGVPIMIYGALSAHANTGDVADLLDPPTLSISTPTGVTYTSASNQFLNVSPVPEPETYGMLFAGLGLLGVMIRRKSAGKV